VTGTIGTGSMNDPYMPLEGGSPVSPGAPWSHRRIRLPGHVITKSDLVLRDLDLLEAIGRKTYAAVTFTVTTSEDALSKRLEPGAPVSSRRLAALQTLDQHGILVGVALMPVLPFIEDMEENIREIARRAHAAGAKYILPAFGMTLRDRQRQYYYTKLDLLFPGLRPRYEKAFGEHYSARPGMPGIWGRSSQKCARNSGWRRKSRSFLPKNIFVEKKASFLCSEVGDRWFFRPCAAMIGR